MPDTLIWRADCYVAPWVRRLQHPSNFTSEGTNVGTNLRRTQSPFVPVGKGSRSQEAQRRPDLQGRRKRRCQCLRTGPFPGHAVLRAMEPPARRGRRHKKVRGRKQVQTEVERTRLTSEFSVPTSS